MSPCPANGCCPIVVGTMSPPSLPPLPPFLSELAALIGRKAALDVALTLGGRKICVPLTKSYPGKLRRHVGAAAADALWELLAGEHFIMPMASAALGHSRQREIGTDPPPRRQWQRLTAATSKPSFDGGPNTGLIVNRTVPGSAVLVSEKSELTRAPRRRWQGLTAATWELSIDGR